MKRGVVTSFDDVEPNAEGSQVANVRPKAWMSRGDFLRLAMLFGLVTGIAELVVRSFTSFILHQPSNHDLGLDLVWMLPAANMILFGALGGLFALASLRWAGERLARIALATFGAAAACAILVHFRSLHEIVSIILSVGVGVRLADILVRRRGRFERFDRRAAWHSVLAVILMAVAFRATAAIAERRALGGLAGSTPGAPNVLLVVLDAVRAADLSVYGYARRTTPELERFAKRSARFEQAIVTAPWTLPSHASLFTGRYAHETSADWNVPLDGRDPTIAEVLRRQGYVTAGFVANNFYGKPEFGLNRGFLHYESRKFSLGATITTGKIGGSLVSGVNRLTRDYHKPGRMDASEINNRILKWLPGDGSRPFFVFVNYFDAHEPYVAPPPFDRQFSGREPLTRRIVPGRRNTKAELTALRDAYNQSIAYLDSQLGVLLRTLERRGLLENTVVIITSDHGEDFGEHGWVGHGNGLYLPSLQVPLLIFFPQRVPAGTVIPEPVTLRDVPATIADFLGLGEQGGFPGRTLSALWTPAGDSSGRRVSPVLAEVSTPDNVPKWYAVSRGDMKSIIVGRHHYIRNGDGREELFDIVADSWETVNLANTQSGRSTLAMARVALDSATRPARRRP